MIKIQEVDSLPEIKKFVKFPFDLYKNNKYWIPPLKKDEEKMLDPDKNPAFSFCDAKFWTAWDGDHCVGRIGAIINHDYNKKIGQKMGRITRAEFVDDQKVADVLFDTAEEWLKSMKMLKVHGPLGFTNFDNQGLLIEGFEYLPSVASVMHMPYYREHYERRSYEKEEDWVEFRLKIEKVPEKARRLAEIIKKRNNLEIIHLKTKKDVHKYMFEVLQLLNRAFDELPYVAPFSDEMIEFSAKKYVDVIQPEFTIVIKKDSKLVAFIVGLPSLSRAMQKAGGSLLPFGFIHIMRALKHPTEMDLLITGVDPHYQKLGLPAILINELQKSMIRVGVKYVETTGMFETNLKGATHWKNYDHIQHKRRRCFVKNL